MGAWAAPSPVAPSRADWAERGQMTRFGPPWDGAPDRQVVQRAAESSADRPAAAGRVRQSARLVFRPPRGGDSEGMPPEDPRSVDPREPDSAMAHTNAGLAAVRPADARAWAYIGPFPPAQSDRQQAEVADVSPMGWQSDRACNPVPTGQQPAENRAYLPSSCQKSATMPRDARRRVARPPAPRCLVANRPEPTASVWSRGSALPRTERTESDEMIASR